jgi:hypothetical protein
LTSITVVIIYFFFPETKGKSLEELAELFGDPVAVRLTDATEAELHEMDLQIKEQLGAHSEHREGNKRE